MKPCPDCDSSNVFRFASTVSSQGGYGPDLLPKLHPSFFTTAKMTPVVCGDCGLLRLYAEKEALAKLSASSEWVRV